MQSAVLSDFDGVLSPIVHPGEPHPVSETVRSSLRRIEAGYRLAAIITGRPAKEARELLQVEGFHVVGNFGLEELPAHRNHVRFDLAALRWRRRVRHVAKQEWRRSLRAEGAHLGDQGLTMVFHWRGAADEDKTRLAIEAAGARAQQRGIRVQRGNKWLAFRPPVDVDKGTAVRRLLRQNSKVRYAIYFGDDTIDIPAMKALEAMVASGRLDGAVRVAVTSPETPQALLDAANLVVNGPSGVATVLKELT